MRVMTPYEKQQATELKGEHDLHILAPLFTFHCAAQCLCLPNFALYAMYVGVITQPDDRAGDAGDDYDEFEYMNNDDDKLLDNDAQEEKSSFTIQNHKSIEVSEEQTFASFLGRDKRTQVKLCP